MNFKKCTCRRLGATSDNPASNGAQTVLNAVALSHGFHSATARQRSTSKPQRDSVQRAPTARQRSTGSLQRKPFCATAPCYSATAPCYSATAFNGQSVLQRDSVQRANHSATARQRDSVQHCPYSVCAGERRIALRFYHICITVGFAWKSDSCPMVRAQYVPTRHCAEQKGDSIGAALVVS